MIKQTDFLRPDTCSNGPVVVPFNASQLRSRSETPLFDLLESPRSSRQEKGFLVLNLFYRERLVSHLPLLTTKGLSFYEIQIEEPPLSYRSFLSPLERFILKTDPRSPDSVLTVQETRGKRHTEPKEKSQTISLSLTLSCPKSYCLYTMPETLFV